IFARVGNHLEFVAARTADRAGIGGYGAKLKAQSREDAHICVIHAVVAFLSSGFVAIEGVSVLHREFAPAHQAEAGAAFVSEFRLDMVEVHRQLAPAVDRSEERRVGKEW